MKTKIYNTLDTIAKHAPIIIVGFHTTVQYVTGPDGARHYFYLYGGKVKSKDNLISYDIFIWKFRLQFSFPGLQSE